MVKWVIDEKQEEPHEQRRNAGWALAFIQAGGPKLPYVLTGEISEVDGEKVVVAVIFSCGERAAPVSTKQMNKTFVEEMKARHRQFWDMAKGG